MSAAPARPPHGDSACRRTQLLPLARWFARWFARVTDRFPARVFGLASTVVLAACAGGPVAPAWELEARGALERYPQLALSGDARAAQAEFRRAREALASTGDTRRVARAELLRCAVQVASLEFTPCEGFERLQAQAGEALGEAERAYADHLAGRLLSPEARALLPADQQRPPAAIEDPLARLVAAGVALRAGRASPETLQLAVDTASAQGWRKPLLAWLGAQAMRAEQAGDAAQAQRLRRRMDLVSGR